MSGGLMRTMRGYPKHLSDAKRKLPFTCYDFFVRDAYDGEVWGPFDSITAAHAVCRRERSTIDSWNRPRITVMWRLSESKILRALALRSGDPGYGSGIDSARDMEP